MPGPFTPLDTMVGAIAHQIALFVKAQIPSVGYVWEEVPDRPPQDNTVMLPITQVRILSDTNGKVKLGIDYSITHVFRRAESYDTIRRAYTYMMPWVQFVTAWMNQNLNGLAISVDGHDVQVTKLMVSGEVVIAVVTRIAVITEFNIVLT